MVVTMFLVHNSHKGKCFFNASINTWFLGASSKARYEHDTDTATRIDVHDVNGLRATLDRHGS